MASFAISNITMSNNRLVIGDTVTIGFTLKYTGGTGETLKKVTFWLEANTTNYPVLARLAYNEPVSIANGSSKKFSYTVTIEDTTIVSLAALRTALNASSAVRALPLTIDGSGYYVTSGSSTQYGVSIDFSLPDAYIMRSRCQPTISLFDFERASGGVPNDEGTSVLTTMKLAMADTNEYPNMDLRLYYAQGTEATTSSASMNLSGSIATLLSGVTNSTTLVTSTFSNGSDWDFLLVFGDAYESTTARTSISRSFANVHLSGASTGGVCFGGFGTSTEGNPKTESYYPIYPYGGIAATSGGATVRTLAFDSDSPFLSYGSNPLPPTLRIFGHVVELHGEIQPTKTLAGGTTYHAICTIPEQYAPEHDVIALQQGTGQSVWMLRIYSKDHAEHPCKAMFARYRSGSAYDDATTSTWLPFHAVWSINGSVSGGGEASVSLLQDSTESYVLDSNGDQVAVAANTPTVQLAHTAAQVDQAIDRTTMLYNLYTSGELQTEIANKVMEELPRYAGEVEDVEGVEDV